ncbi:helix-turn-helix domain-containing protein [Bradyrhizobium sp. ISRA442]|uniref:helix-turn-helix domain-containing protein n=1 Tax=Bradyrhizobium sp. ISRA442 TaxID=2866197 RepID=UPI00311B39F8
MDIRKVFGENAREFRLALGLSQEAVAERMSVDRAFISSMERGLQNATLLTVADLSSPRGSASRIARREDFQDSFLMPAAARDPA